MKGLPLPPPPPLHRISYGVVATLKIIIGFRPVLFGARKPVCFRVASRSHLVPEARRMRELHIYARTLTVYGKLVEL